MRRQRTVLWIPQFQPIRQIADAQRGFVAEMFGGVVEFLVAIEIKPQAAFAIQAVVLELLKRDRIIDLRAELNFPGVMTGRVKKRLLFSVTHPQPRLIRLLQRLLLRIDQINRYPHLRPEL